MAAFSPVFLPVLGGNLTVVRILDEFVNRSLGYGFQA